MRALADSGCCKSSDCRRRGNVARHILYFMQERTNCQPAKKTAHEDGHDGIGGGRIGDVGKYIQKTKMKIMLFGNGFFRKKDINSTYD